MVRLNPSQKLVNYIPANVNHPLMVRFYLYIAEFMVEYKVEYTME